MHQKSVLIQCALKKIDKLKQKATTEEKILKFFLVLTKTFHEKYSS